MLGHTILSTQRIFLDWKWNQFHENLLFNFVFYIGGGGSWKWCSVLCLEGPTHQDGPSGSVGSTNKHENKSNFFKNKNFRQYWTWHYLTESNPNTSWFWKTSKWCSRLCSASSNGLSHSEDQKLTFSGTHLNNCIYYTTQQYQNVWTQVGSAGSNTCEIKVDLINLQWQFTFIGKLHFYLVIHLSRC